MNANSAEPDSSSIVLRQIYAFSAAYGLAAGTAYAFTLWGRDAYLLSQAHAFFPWLKLILGTLLCGIVVGTASWLAARKENGCLGFFLWLAAALALAWVTVGLPLQIMPILSKYLEPELNGLVNYEIGTAFMARFWIAVVWVAIFMSLTGILQSNLVESGVSSISVFGKISPFLVGISLMGMGGLLLDDLTNAPFRKAIYSVETPIQFILDNQGKEMDPALSREFHASAFRNIQTEITPSRHLIVSQYDESFGLINVLIKFEDAWVDCTTVYGQITFCEPAEADSAR